MRQRLLVAMLAAVTVIALPASAQPVLRAQ